MPDSTQDAFATLRAEAEWRIPHVREELNAAITCIEEQLKAAEEVIEAARLYLGGIEEGTLLVAFAYKVASYSASKPYCTCPEGADGNPCAVCGKPEAVTYQTTVGK